jgi:hypothetical protein
MPVEDVAVSDVLGSQLLRERELEKFFRTATPQSLKANLAGMPASAPEQLAYLNLMLKVLSELDVQPVQVFSLLETMRPVVYEKFNVLTSRFFGKSAAFPPRVQELLNQAVSLQSHMAATYDSVVEEARAQGDKQAFIVGTAIQRAMADKAHLLYCYLQLYLPVPQQMWKQFHKLYKVAVEYKLLSQAVPDVMVFPRKPLNLRQIYLYAMMMGSSNTQRMNSADIVVLSEALKEWVQFINLTDKRTADPENQLVINLDVGVPPLFLTEVNNKLSPNLVFLQNEKFIAHVKSLPKYKIRSGFEEKVLDKSMLDQLIQQWTEYRPKSVDRLPRNEKVLITLGLPALHYYMSGGAELQEIVGKTSLDDAEPTGRLAYGEIPREFGGLAFKPAQNKLDRRKFFCEPVVAVDESPGGYCLEWEESSPGLAVGEIIGIKERLSPYWRVGEVVWMNKLDSSKISAGISIICSDAIPVVARVPKNSFSGKGGNNVLGLLCPADNSLNRKESVVMLPSMKLQMGEKMRFTHLGASAASQHALQLMKPVKEHASCIEFECAFILPEA